MTNKEFVDSLRLIADFYKENLEMPLPHLEGRGCLDIFSIDSKEDVARVAAIFGSCKKHIDDTFYRVSRKFGAITLEVVAMRGGICTRRVVGTKTIQKTRPVKFETVEEQEDIVEWDCPEALLAPEPKEAKDAAI